MNNESTYNPSEKDVLLTRYIGRQLDALRVSGMSGVYPETADYLSGVSEPNVSDGVVEADNDPLLDYLSDFRMQSRLRAEEAVASYVFKRLDLRDADSWSSRSTEKKEAGIYVLSATWLRVAAALVAGIILLTLYHYSQISEEVLLVSSGTERTTWVLEDESVITLRPNSYLFAVPAASQRGDVALRLEGEAYFDIVSNPDRTLSIHTSDAIVSVLGTQFNVQARKNDITRVFLNEGMVQVTSTDGTTGVLLNPGHFVEIIDGNPVHPLPASGLRWTSWLRDEIVLDHRSLADLSAELGHHFDVHIVVSEMMKHETLSGTLVLGNLQQVLEDLALSLEVDIVKSGEDTYQLKPIVSEP